MKKYLVGQWVGISFIHWLIIFTWGIYLTTYPLSNWSLYHLEIALSVFLSSLIVCFWTIYLLNCYFRLTAKSIIRFWLPVFRVIYVLGQTTTLLIVMIGTVKVLLGFLSSEVFFRLSDRLGFWIVISLAIAQGLQHYFYKFLSGSTSRLDGLLDRIGRDEPIDWRYPIGGSIGVELRRLRRIESRERGIVNDS